MFSTSPLESTAVQYMAMLERGNVEVIQAILAKNVDT